MNSILKDTFNTVLNKVRATLTSKKEKKKPISHKKKSDWQRNKYRIKNYNNISQHKGDLIDTPSKNQPDKKTREKTYFGHFRTPQLIDKRVHYKGKWYHVGQLSEVEEIQRFTDMRSNNPIRKRKIYTYELIKA